MYADHLVIFSPSSAGLQQRLTTCTVYGVKHDIKHGNKSAFLVCRTKD